ncbi:Uncharacterized protein ALO83_04869 [Pseudomonas cannabina pv. alisalensis]|uniref:Uncharacterized protein n=1 Tax=Pseudomonas cannabina TaxID=86840 RepID=A0A3M3R4G6_PSECA|nr:Uncharacterized protein ALO83_04869 [Pseudomonas cannabina pv. alisalensis]RMN84416.1 hypothetical protein ALQ53_04646 [Pseudomonas cannabina]RMN86208.1 hypothetical protein ALQ52_101647 [Pseudomonas cannabina pv. alisalensis]RMN91163.1 hypothetical protein ALQ51_05503 [Pseudomonas cannabina]
MNELRAHPGNTSNPGKGAQFPDHAGQVHTVVHADHQLDHADATIALVHADFFDVAIGRVDTAGQQGDQAALMLQFDTQLDVEFAGNVLGPRELDAFFRVVTNFANVAAVIQVHDHAFASRKVTDNRVARYRRAAFGVTEYQAFGAANGQRTLRTWQLIALAQQTTGDDIGHAIAQADVFKQIFQHFDPVFGQHQLDTLLGHLVQAAFETVEHLVQQALAKVDRLGAALQLERVTNVRTGLAGDDKVQPCRVRTCAGSADNLDRGAALQRFGQRGQSTVDPAGNAAVADIGMYRVSEVHGGGAFGQLHDPAFRREHVDLVRKQVDLDAFDEFQRVARALLHLQHALDPLPGASMSALGLLVVAGLVQPVRGNPVIGHLFHFTGANLDFNRHAVHAEQRGMQRLVAVGLWNRDVILEAAGQWLVQIVYSTQHAIAGIDLVDDDTERVNVHDLVEGPALAAHLFVNTVKMFLPPADIAFDTVDCQAMAQGLFDLVDQLLAIAPGALDRLVDSRGAHRVHGLEAEVFEFDTHVVHAQPVGDGRVDFEGFLGDAATLLAGQNLQRAHVVQPVGELDQDHANIARHGHGHLLEVFRLSFGFGLEIHLGQFADPVDQFCDGFTKLRTERFLGNTGVFDDVMQHRSHQALMVHVHVGKNIGHRERVGYIGFAAATALAVVGLFGIEIRSADQIDLVFAEVGRQSVGEGVYARQGATPCQWLLPCAVPRRPGIGLDGLVGLVLERCEQWLIFNDFGFCNYRIIHHASRDFAQCHNGRLVIFPRQLWLFATGCQLTGTLCGEHDQLKAVIHVF